MSITIAAVMLGIAVLGGLVTGMLIEWSVAVVVWLKRRRRNRG
jgi:uncharacterized integral membrane protein